MASNPTALPRAKMAKRAPQGSRRTSGPDLRRDRLSNALEIAHEKGLLQGRRTMVIRGRMPEELVAEAKRRSGITSDSKLLETALANIAAADDYADWLFSQRGDSRQRS